MSLSSFSLILGVYFYVFGFPLVFSDDKFIAWMKKFTKDENMLRLTAVVIISIAVTTLRRQSMLTFDGEGLIVLLAWIVLLKGLVFAWWPGRLIRMTDSMTKMLFSSQGLLAFVGFVMVLLGALFTYLGVLLP